MVDYVIDNSKFIMIINIFNNIFSKKTINFTFLFEFL